MFEILLIEDNPGDVDLTKEALRDAGVETLVLAAPDGFEALALLRRKDAWTAGRPNLILLDLNLPKKSGLEVLAEIRADAALGDIPVIILSSSEAETDIANSYRLHANCYVAKSLTFEDFASTCKAVAQFWFGVAKLPSGTNGPATAWRRTSTDEMSIRPDSL